MHLLPVCSHSLAHLLLSRGGGLLGVAQSTARAVPRGPSDPDAEASGGEKTFAQDLRGSGRLSSVTVTSVLGARASGREGVLPTGDLCLPFHALDSLLDAAAQPGASSPRRPYICWALTESWPGNAVWVEVPRPCLGLA